MIYPKIDFNKMLEQIRTEIPLCNHDPRVSALLFESNASYIIREMTKIYLKSELLDDKQGLQISLLVEKGLIDTHHKSDIELLKSIRNLMGHSPDIFDKDVKEKFHKLVDQIPTRLLQNAKAIQDAYLTLKVGLGLPVDPKNTENIAKFEMFAGTLIINLIGKYDNVFDKYNHEH